MENEATKALVPILIPAYQPGVELLPLCEALLAKGLPVLVVDDGGAGTYRHLFQKLSAIGCTVLTHAVNYGKGRALKTGINAALLQFPHMLGLVTADADGQHTVPDILRMVDALIKNDHALVLGVRTFEGEVPWKSRFGNGLTRLIYRFVAGIACTDTQTGLRGLPMCALAQFAAMAGERYEYEMEMLLRAKALGLSITEIPIETVYLNDNAASHFHPMRDGFRIYVKLARFAMSSFLSFLVDYGIYILLLSAVGLAPWLSYGLARLVSSVFNFTVNRFTVFNNQGGRFTILRYYLVASGILATGSSAVYLLSQVIGLPAVWVKIPVDLLLWMVNFTLQRDFVFSQRLEAKKEG